MASIAQALTSSVAGATNQGGTDPGTVAPVTQPLAVGAISRPQDTVNLTETGARNVAVAAQSGRATVAPAFQVTYFPPSSAPGARTAGAQGNAALTTAAVPAKTNNPTAQVANAAAEAAATNSANTTTSGAGAGSRVARSTSPISSLSAASQAKLQKLDQVLQQLGINPSQISFADRIALLPLANDPAAIQQYIQGLPTQTAVLNPATSQVLAPSLVSQQGGTQSAAAGSANRGAGSLVEASGAIATGSNGSTDRNAATVINPSPDSFTAAVASSTRASDATGQKVNISV